MPFAESAFTRYLSAMSTLVEIQKAITRLGKDEKAALSLWLESQSARAMTALDEDRLLRSLDEAIRDVDTGKGVPLEEARKLPTCSRH
jgi:hypothetical protein